MDLRQCPPPYKGSVIRQRLITLIIGTPSYGVRGPKPIPEKTPLLSRAALVTLSLLTCRAELIPGPHDTLP